MNCSIIAIWQCEFNWIDWIFRNGPTENVRVKTTWFISIIRDIIVNIEFVVVVVYLSFPYHSSVFSTKITIFANFAVDQLASQSVCQQRRRRRSTKKIANRTQTNRFICIWMFAINWMSQKYSVIIISMVVYFRQRIEIYKYKHNDREKRGRLMIYIFGKRIVSVLFSVK